MENKIDKNDFSVLKVKLGKNGGLDVHYTLHEVNGNDVYNNKYHVENTKDIHPDLRKAIKGLRAFLAVSVGYARCIDIAQDEKEDVRAMADKYFAEMCNNIQVTGVAYSGEGINTGVVITGVLDCGEYGTTAIVSPRLHFLDDKIPFAKELAKIVMAINDEVFMFLFEDKKAQLEIFGND